MQFKVGDRVQAIGAKLMGHPSWEPIRDKVGTVTRIGCFIMVDFGIKTIIGEREWHLTSNELKLIEPGHFMCHVEGMRGPKVVHDTLELATAEAKRLAKVERGKDVYILKAVAVVRAEKPILPEAVVKTL